MTVHHTVYAAQSTAPLAPRTDGLAIASFVCGLCGLGLIPVVLGHVSLARIKRQGLGGQGFALVGLILGYLTILTIAIVILVAFSGVIWAVNT